MSNAGRRLNDKYLTQPAAILPVRVMLSFFAPCVSVQLILVSFDFDPCFHSTALAVGRTRDKGQFDLRGKQQSTRQSDEQCNGPAGSGQAAATADGHPRTGHVSSLHGPYAKHGFPLWAWHVSTVRRSHNRMPHLSEKC